MSEEQVEALKVLIHAARVAQSRGCFRLAEAENLSRAVRVFSEPQPSSIPDLVPAVQQSANDNIPQE